jgi:type IV secretion system protein TrbG
MRKLALISLIGLAVNCWAQNKPVTVKRTPAPPSAQDGKSLQKKIEADLEALRQDPLPNGSSPGRSPTVGGATQEQVPADFKPNTDLPLTPSAEAAIKVSEKWLTETVTPAPGPDGRVLYSYGAGLATVVCAPLRVCTVELQSGETLVGEPHIGDSVRWNISPALYGKGESSTTVIIVKPQAPGLDTSLLITTDRRVYYLRLVSKPEDYTARVAFAYPNDELAEQKWKDHLLQQEQEKREASRISELAPDAVESMNFSYVVKGDEALRPVQVFDDGAKTYIRMKSDLIHREAPVLVVVGTDGKSEMLNYRVKADMYIADRLFERAQLVLGAGKKVRKVEIIRATPRNKS